MADPRVGFEIFYDGAWHDIVVDDDVFADAPIVVRRGQGDESAAPRPAQITARLANDDDRYRTSNPLSPLYGKAARNTPVRVSVDDVVRGAVEASTWEADQTDDFRRTPRRGRAWVDFLGGGIRQRINQWTEPLRSTFYTQNATAYPSTAVGYFSCEELPHATTLTGTVDGSTLLEFNNVETGTQYRFAGSAPLVSLSSDALLTVVFKPTGLTDSGWQFSWTSQHDQILSSGLTGLIQFGTVDGTSYSISYSNGTDLQINITAGDGTSLVNNAISFGDLDYTKWNMWRVKVTSSAGTVSVELSWYTENAATFSGTTWTFAGQTSSLYYGACSSGHSTAPGLRRYGHFLGLSTGADDLESAARTDSFNGYKGETAAARFVRLCALKNVSATVIGSAAASMPLGVQPLAPFGEQLDEIERSEDGLIFDAVDAIQLVFMLRAARYAQTPAIALQATDLPGLPKEVTDDLNTHNLVTVSQRDGGEATAEDSTGPLGTQPPPDGVGEALQRVDVNIDDTGLLPLLAGWWLNRGTVDLPRYPNVIVNLSVLTPGQVAQVEAIDVGSVITIDGYREYTIRLQVIGYTEKIPWRRSRTITFVCVPDQQFDVGVYDSTVKRYDLRSSTLAAAAGVGDTTLTFTTTEDETWSSASAYDLLIAGELVGIPAGVMGARTGTGPWTQVATGVVRGRNGIMKALSAAEQVHAVPGRFAL